MNINGFYTNNKSNKLYFAERYGYLNYQTQHNKVVIYYPFDNYSGVDFDDLNVMDKNEFYNNFTKVKK